MSIQAHFNSNRFQFKYISNSNTFKSYQGRLGFSQLGICETSCLLPGDEALVWHEEVQARHRDEVHGNLAEVATQLSLEAEAFLYELGAPQ